MSDQIAFKAPNRFQLIPVLEVPSAGLDWDSGPSAHLFHIVLDGVKQVDPLQPTSNGAEHDQSSLAMPLPHLLGISLLQLHSLHRDRRRHGWWGVLNAYGPDEHPCQRHVLRDIIFIRTALLSHCLTHTAKKC